MKRNITKENVLEILIENSTRYISGEEIAEKLYITRSAVWKSIKSLREDGKNIEAISNRGYRLIDVNVGLSSKGIKNLLPESLRNLDINCLETVTSTNDLANEWGRDNFGKEKIIIAEEQTNGRGRRGRDFYSPKETGLYMSLCIFPQTSVEKATLITCLAAVAICNALSEVAGIDAKIKWVNDIFYKDKKIAGILTEGVTSIEDGGLSYMVVGIGINLYDPIKGFPEEIKKTAGSIFTTGRTVEDVRNKIAAAIIKNFYVLYEGDWKEIVQKYKELSFLIGKTIVVNPINRKDSSKEYVYAKAIDIDEDCHLIIEHENGKIETLSTGEVSVAKY